MEHLEKNIVTNSTSTKVYNTNFTNAFYFFAFMFLDDIKLFTLSRGIVSLNSSEVPRQHLMAGAVIATAPVLFLFLWFEKFLVSGLTTGSVKG